MYTLAARRGFFVALGLGVFIAIWPQRTLASTSPPTPIATATAHPLQQRLTLEVTGNPTRPEFLADRIRQAVRGELRAAIPAGVAHLGTILPQPQPLGSGFLTTFALAFEVASANARTVTGNVTVDVINAGLPAFAPTLLDFADDPEKIVANGVLSRTQVAVDRPTRLYYYHENVAATRRFVVVLAVRASVTTHVQFIDADAGPNFDVMSVGHAVSKAFVARQPHNEGVVMTLAGGKPMIERDTLLRAGEGIVGTLDMRVLDGGPVTATVEALLPDADPFAYLYAPVLPDDGHARHGTFDLRQFGARVIAYTVGGPDAAISYGQRNPSLANIDPASSGRDYGDYGVVWHVTFDLANPTSASATTYLYERPQGGAVRSSFTVNDALIDIGCARLPQRYLIAPLILAPHTTQVLDVRTMTDGGSNYPLELGVTQRQPLVQTPPVTAPDGCFPKPRAPRAVSE